MKTEALPGIAVALWLAAAGAAPVRADPPDQNAAAQARYRELFGDAPPQTLELGLTRLAEAHPGLTVRPGPVSADERGLQRRAFHIFRRGQDDLQEHVATAHMPADAAVRDTLLWLDSGLSRERGRPASGPDTPGLYFAGGMPTVDALFPPGARDPGRGTLEEFAGYLRQQLGFGRLTVVRTPDGFRIDFQRMADRGGAVPEGLPERYAFGRNGLVRLWEL